MCGCQGVKAGVGSLRKQSESAARVRLDVLKDAAERVSSPGGRGEEAGRQSLRSEENAQSVGKREHSPCESGANRTVCDAEPANRQIPR